jgi:hypothetical protein
MTDGNVLAAALATSPAHADTSDGRGKVCVGFLSGVDVSTDFMRSVINTHATDQAHQLGRLQHPNWWLNQRSGVNVSGPRNQLVATFLAMDDPAPEWLLMVDADMCWQSAALESLLLAADRLTAEQGARYPVVGGLCIAFGADPDSPDGGNHVVATCYRPGPPMEGVAVAPFESMPPDDVPDATLLEVYGTGAAFLLVHRQVLIDILCGASQPYPWFRETVVPDERPDVPIHQRNGYWLSEDLFFCLQVQRAGHRLFVHTGVEVQHVKAIRLTTELWRSYRKAVDPA